MARGYAIAPMLSDDRPLLQGVYEPLGFTSRTDYLDTLRREGRRFLNRFRALLKERPDARDPTPHQEAPL
jgi:hypothetical protein